VSVTLRDVTKDNVRTLCELRVAPGQERFVAPTAYTIAEAAYEDEVLLRGIYDGDEPIGLVAVVHDQDGDWFMARLMVAAGRQRTGIGRRAMALLYDELRARGADTLLTSYVDEDGGAGPFYGSLGFTPTGDVNEGETVVRLDLKCG
jgi:diamine N-acetyltransferase